MYVPRAYPQESGVRGQRLCATRSASRDPGVHHFGGQLVRDVRLALVLNARAPTPERLALQFPHPHQQVGLFVGVDVLLESFHGLLTRLDVLADHEGIAPNGGGVEASARGTPRIHPKPNVYFVSGVALASVDYLAAHVMPRSPGRRPWLAVPGAA